MPGAHAEVLVLEDEPDQLARLGEAVSAAGLVPLLAEQPRKALAMLDVHRPVLAVVDLDMSKAEWTGRTAEEVLARLYERHGVCTPILYSVNVGGVEQRDRIAGIHPYALVQDKRDGEEALLQRMRRLLRARFGDLAIDGGAIRHLPSGRVFSHRVGVSLVLARRANLEVALDDSEARAARRFQRWLREQVGSTVRVRPYRNRHYELELVDGEAPAAPRAPRGGPNQGAEVLVLEDDPDERLQVEGVVSRLQLTPLLAADPRQALEHLERHRPVMAIVDLNMSRAPDTGRKVAEVLSTLYERHGGCIPIVYSANVADVQTRDWVAAQHAFALVQDKRDGEAGLRERIGRLLRARFGDLHISGGRVRHEPTGKDFSHRVAVALLVATRAESSDVVLDESEGRAARRFERWLRDEVDSAVHVRHERNHYELVLLGERRVAAAAGGPAGAARPG
jgi:CheY-like chemotaxis protein